MSFSEALLHVAVQHANTCIWETASFDQSKKGMGTTVVAVRLDSATEGGVHHMAACHAGDSRAYLWRNGKLRRLTQDHNLLAELEAQLGRPPTRQEEEEFPYRNVITKAVGLKESLDPEVRRGSVMAGDVVLLCSDGLTGMVDDDVVAGVLARGDTLQAQAGQLVQCALDGGGKDNVTVVLGRIG
jgi:protein phosphatase